MRKSLLLAAVVGTFILPTAAMADEAAAPAGAPVVAAAPAEPASPHTFSYNLGLYSQYVFRGLTQTAYKPAIQGGVDYSHASGFYLGSWGSNINWLEDSGVYDNSSLELDVYGGYRNTFGDSGIGYDVGLLNYIYPGNKTQAADGTNFVEPYTLELYGAISYKWFQAKLSYGLTDIFGVENSDGSYYFETNSNIPIGESGFTVNLHVGRQEYTGHVRSLGIDNDDLYTYTDWKVGVTKSWSNGVNVGGYYTDTDAEDAGYGNHFYDVDNIGDDTFTVFVQKTF